MHRFREQAGDRVPASGQLSLKQILGLLEQQWRFKCRGPRPTACRTSPGNWADAASSASLASLVTGGTSYLLRSIYKRNVLENPVRAPPSPLPASPVRDTHLGFPTKPAGAAVGDERSEKPALQPPSVHSSPQSGGKKSWIFHQGNTKGNGY